MKTTHRKRSAGPCQHVMQTGCTGRQNLLSKAPTDLAVQLGRRCGRGRGRAKCVKEEACWVIYPSAVCDLPVSPRFVSCDSDITLVRMEAEGGPHRSWVSYPVCLHLPAHTLNDCGTALLQSKFLCGFTASAHSMPPKFNLR